MGFPELCGIGRSRAFKGRKETRFKDASQDRIQNLKIAVPKQEKSENSVLLFKGCCTHETTLVQPSLLEKKSSSDHNIKPIVYSFVKETCVLIEDEDFDGNKIINDYVRLHKIGGGSHCKVVLYRSKLDSKLYAMKVFRKSRLSRIKINQLETVMNDVLREVAIAKRLCHPNIVKLVEVIDDPRADRLCMVLEYLDKGWIFKGAGPPGGIGEKLARAYFQDIVAGLKYLHDNNIMHGDIKPENLLLNSDGRVKICDFSASRFFEDGNDKLHRCAGTPVFTAPECSEGLVYHGKIADIWALGVTLYCMVFGKFPFLGDTLCETFDKIVNMPLEIPPDNVNEDLADLLRRLLCKDPKKRISLVEVMRHPWVVQWSKRA